VGPRAAGRVWEVRGVRGVIRGGWKKLDVLGITG